MYTKKRDSVLMALAHDTLDPNDIILRVEDETLAVKLSPITEFKIPDIFTKESLIDNFMYNSMIQISFLVQVEARVYLRIRYVSNLYLTLIQKRQ